MEYEFLEIMNLLASHMNSINLYSKIFCDSGKSDSFCTQGTWGQELADMDAIFVRIRIRRRSIRSPLRMIQDDLKFQQHIVSS